MAKTETATETQTATPTIEFVDFVPAVKPNQYDATVAALIEQGEGKAVKIADLPAGEVQKHKVSFQKAANAAGYTGRVQSEDETSVTFTLTARQKRLTNAEKAERDAAEAQAAAEAETAELFAE